MSLIETIGPSLLKNIPELLAWGIGIILGVIMVRRGGARAEKLFLAGCSLMFTHRPASPLIVGVVQWLASEQGMSNIYTAQSMGIARLIPGLLFGLTGFVCLVSAFWIRFRKGRREAA